MTLSGGQYPYVDSSPASFEQLFRGYYRDVYRYLVRRVDPDAAQDVAAEAFLVAWRRYGELRGDPLPWLLGIARRTAANHRRGENRRDALKTRLAAEHRRSSVEGHDHDSKLMFALATLSERDREALMLIAWDGLEHHIAASVMGCSTTAFTVRVHRARGRLRRALNAENSAPISATEPTRSMQ